MTKIYRVFQFLRKYTICNVEKSADSAKLSTVSAAFKRTLNESAMLP
jgi:hypothetical protein